MRLVIDLQGAQGCSHARGIGRYSRELASAMARQPRDHEVIIALSSAFVETAETLLAHFAGFLPRHQIRLWHPPRGTAEILGSPNRPFAEALRAQFLASLQPDLVLVSSLFEGMGDDVITLLPTHFTRLPMVAICYDLIPLIRHGQYFGTSAALSPNARSYYRCVHEMSLCEGLLAISESSRNEALRHLRFPEERVFNIQTGISTDFRPVEFSAESRTALMAQYGLTMPFILFLGAGDIRKNEVGLIAAYSRLPRQLRERHQLLIVGKVDAAALHRTATQLGLEAANFVVVPFVAEQDLNALYSACTLFVFPSLHEGFGLPLAEAMACGAPSIASNTTSLPEVIGRTDATFDPTDPDDLAGCMRKVLEDPDFRAELAAYGPVQAARFTWPASAGRAWDALETIHAIRVRENAPRACSVLQRRKRLAFVSPLPPQTSGIADYSAELLPYLARHYDITLVTEAEIEDARLAAAFPRCDSDSFLRDFGDFDRVLYQIGNSSFHRFQIEHLLPRCPGVVVLHDAFLSDYMNWVAHENGRPDDFRAVLLHSHGYAALRHDAERGRHAALAYYPCCLSVLQGAIGLIQHSRHGVDVLAQYFDPREAGEVTIIPLLRSVEERPSRTEARAILGLRDDVFVVCSLGGVTPAKCPMLLAEAWRRSGISGLLVFAGSAPQDLGETLEQSAPGISVTGRLSRSAYHAWIAAADMAVQWRTGSRGETSAAIGDALAAGLPVIVNRHGSAAELPSDIVLALPGDAGSDALAEALTALYGDAARRATLSAASRAYAQRELSPGLAARRYVEAIERAYSRTGPAAVAGVLRHEALATVADPKGPATAALAVARSFPSHWREGGRQRLLVDISELARRNHGSGIQRVVCELGRRIMETPPAGWEGRAVRLHDGRLRQTYAIPLSILGHAELPMVETPFNAGAGDVLLCADVNAEMTEVEFDELKRLRLNGMRIALLVHDLLPLRRPEMFPANIAELVSIWYRRMLTIADCVLCTSRAGADDLLAWLSEATGRRATPLPIGYVHLGADFNIGSAAAPISQPVQAALDSALECPSILMVGTLEPRKGYSQSLAAFDQLWRDGEQISLIIVGKQGWNVASLIDQLHASPERGNRLHWLPDCDDATLRRLYSVASGLLMASSNEGFGLPIVEAAHARLPVMARDLPVFREIAGVNARYFAGDDAASLAVSLRAWAASGFTPSTAGLVSLSWNETFARLIDAVVHNRLYATWQG